MLQIAKILKSNGTDGGVLIGLWDISAQEIDLQEPVFIEFDGLPVPFFIQDIQPKGSSRAIVHLNDVCNLKDAEELVGRAVYMDAELVEEEEADFVGWTVLDKGVELGRVTGFEPIPGNYCLYIGDDIMIPLHEDFVLSIDEEAQVLDLDLPEGLY